MTALFARRSTIEKTIQLQTVEGLKSLLSAILQNPGIQTRNASTILGNRPVKTLERQIKLLVEKNLIERRGSKKTGGYFIKE